jgi:hypothetical protein
MQVLMSDLAPERARGRFFAISRMVAEWGNIGHPILFSAIYLTLGYAIAFGWVGMCAIGVVYIIGFRLKETVAAVGGPRRPRRGEPEQVATTEDEAVHAAAAVEPKPQPVTPPAG